MDFSKPFDEAEWRKHLGKYFISEHKSITNKEKIKEKFGFLKDAKSFGTLKFEDGEEMPVYILKVENTKKATRVKLTSLAYGIIKDDIKIGSALFFILYEDDDNNYRFSYVKASRGIKQDENTGEKKAVNIKSDPKRYTYILGKNSKTHTAETRLKKEIFVDEKTIEEAFSVEPVNKEFYKGIKKYFDELSDDVLKYFGNDKKEANEFSLRFLGRLLFCRFLREKELIPKEILKIDCIDIKKQNYYEEVLSILFFNVLNETIEERTLKNTALEKYEKDIPFLNGGLFSKKEEDIKVEKIDNSIIKEIFEFFEKYNFTVDESTPIDIEISIDPEMLGRIFENLLAEINPETEKAARKETGSFYTPREIVDYMVVESIKLYLKRKLPDLKEKADKLFLIDDEDIIYSEEEKKKIFETIHDMKILDPACGSGAFPMGILQRVFMIINKLDPYHKYYKEFILEKLDGAAKTDIEKRIKDDKLDYAYKLDILQSMIHGVDIQPMAIELSRLRAFLSLIVEENKDLNDEYNLGIRPLPNLEFQFITANSLIGLDLKIDKSLQNTFESHALDGILSRMQNVSKLYFNAHSEKEKDFAKHRFEEFRGFVVNTDFIEEKDKKVFLSWKPFENMQGEFFNSYIQFGIENFDIVIGNPPYIDSEHMVKIYGNEYREIISNLYSVVKGNWDLYIPFFGLGFNLLNNNGVLIYITPDKWISKDFGIALRTYSLKHFDVLMNCGRDIFKSSRVDAVISGFTSGNTDYIRILKYINNQFVFLKNINKQTITKPYRLDNLFSNYKYILDKMENNKILFSKYGLCYSACATSDAYKLKPLLEEHDKHKLKDYYYFINTGTIDKYSHKWGSRKATYLKDKYLFPIVEKNNFKKEFTLKSGKYSKYVINTDKAKLIIKGLSLLNCCIDIDGKIIAGKTTLIVLSNNIKILKCLMAILNNPCIKFYIKEQYPSSSYNQGISFSQDMINNLPVPCLTKDIEDKITTLVDVVLTKKEKSLDTTKEEKEIDNIVYKLYGLTDEEIKIVEGK